LKFLKSSIFSAEEKNVIVCNAQIMHFMLNFIVFSLGGKKISISKLILRKFDINI